MAYSSSAVHSHQRRSAAENGRLVFSLLWLASEILVERNNSSTVWPIHRMIRYKIKQKSLLNSKLWSGPLCCQNNNINWEQGQSRWERGLVRAAKEQEDLQRHLNLWDRLGGAFFFFFFGENFCTRIQPELQGKGQNQSQVDWATMGEASRIFLSQKVLRAHRKPVSQLVLLESSHHSPLLPPALTLVWILRSTWRFLGQVYFPAQRVSL